MEPFATLNEEFKKYLTQLVESGRLNEMSGSISVGIARVIVNSCV